MGEIIGSMWGPVIFGLMFLYAVSTLPPPPV